LEAQNAEFSMNDIEYESAIAAPLHLVPSREESAHTFKDVLVDAAVQLSFSTRLPRIDRSDAPANRFPREGHEPVDPRPMHSGRSELPSGYPLLYLPPGLCRCRRPLGQPD
jgi:hypothetical protein